MSAQSRTIDRAVPVVRRAKGTDAAKVETAKSVVGAMQQSPLWGDNAHVQASANGWSQATAALGANAKLIAELKAQLAVASARQLGLRRDWMAAMKHVLGSVATATQGSADAVQAYGLDVRTHARRGVLLPAPAALRTTISKSRGEAVVQWDRGGARHGFLVQQASDPADPSTFSAVIPCTKTTYRVRGLPSGANAFVRVAAIDPHAEAGHSPFGDWAAVTAG